MSVYSVFTDGAYTPTLGQGGSGIVVFRDGKSVLEYSKTFKGGTNNTAEICAIILALKCFKLPVDKIVIYSDSAYCINVINKGWSRNANQSLWRVFDDAYERVKRICSDVSFEWVKGHTGNNPGNDRADEIAVQASKRIIK